MFFLLLLIFFVDMNVLGINVFHPFNKLIDFSKVLLQISLVKNHYLLHRSTKDSVSRLFLRQSDILLILFIKLLDLLDLSIIKHQ